MSLTNSPFWMAQTAAGSLYDYEIENSARMTSDNSSYLQRTPSTSGNRDTWTFSCWMKRTELNGGGERIFGAGDDLVNPGNHNNTITLYFDNHNLRFRQESGGSANMDLRSSAVYRDTSAWYHIVAVYDSTNGTSGDRARMYVNGERITALSINDPDPGSGTDSNCMRAGHIMRIGRSTSGYHNHNLAEVHWVDGSALEPTSFGETKSGVWIPKEYSGSHGTNGVYLKFANSAAFGTDSSGNGNTFSTGGLTTHDQLPDSPTNNFPTNRKGFNQTASEGSLRFERTSNANNHTGNFPNVCAKTGKWYCELRMIDSGIDTAGFAVVEGRSYNEPADNTAYQYTVDNNTIIDGKGYYSWIINAKKTDGFAQSETSYGTALTANVAAIIMCALDLDNGKVWWGKDGTWFNSGDPAAGTNAAFTSSNLTDSNDGWGFASSLYMGRGNAIHIFNYGQDSTFAGNETAGGNADDNGYGDFKYAPPSGFLSMCSANLPDPAIDPAADNIPADYFDTVLYTAASSNGTYNIGNASFVPDFTWIKNRDNVEEHYLFDVVRGNSSITNKFLNTNSTDPEGAGGVSGTTVTSQLGGMQVVESSINTGELYFNSRTYAMWNWKAGGTGVSNTDGSITSTVSANQDSGFSVVTYSGNGSSGATVGHGLSNTPSMIIVQTITGSNNRSKPVYHSGIGNTAAMILDNTSAKTTSSAFWNNTSPNSSVFTLGNDQNTNQSGSTYVAYCFADVEGYSKAGLYVGNSSSDGPFIHTGFRPAWVMIKNTNSTGGSGQHWQIADNKRNTYNLVNTNLLAENVAAEGHTWSAKDFLSNGLKIRGSNYALNYNSDTYIYLAFAENPFKYANAR